MLGTVRIGARFGNRADGCRKTFNALYRCHMISFWFDCKCEFLSIFS